MHRMMLAAAMLTATLADAGTTPLPFDVGGEFLLIDQFGNPRSQADPDGKGQLLFFGYANCPGICSTAMPMIADSVDALDAAGIAVTPVMITVDPARDKVGEMHGPLQDLHPDFIGLTGSDAALQAAYSAFSVEKELAFVDPDYGPVYTHGSFVYLLDPDGAVLTLFPPILASDRVVELARQYLGSAYQNR